MAAEGRLADGRRNATFDAHEATEFNEHYNLIWHDALDTAIEGCKGLLTLATEKHVQELESDKHMWFVLFLIFSGISLVAICAMLYLISSMRTFVSLRKCLVSQWESRDSRPNPQSLL